MIINLPYGNRLMEINLPDSCIKADLRPKPMQPSLSEIELVEYSLKHPIDSPLLSEIAIPGETVCIIVGDMTRLWVRHHVLLPPIIEELNKVGIPDKDIFIISATGDHREQSSLEHMQLVGEDIYRRIQVFDHHARKKEEHLYLGTTSYGTPVSINKRVVDADRVVITGGIVYHFLAGWGGGKKSIIPGVASYETIMKNHSLAFHPGGRGLNPEVRAGNISNNPCCSDMEQGADLVSPDFLVNSVVNEETHLISAVVSGNYRTAHKEGCEIVRKQFGVKINEPADVVIASCGGYPKDINFYQTYKTLYNAHFALRKGGTMVLFSKCPEGIGSKDFERFFEHYENNRQREKALQDNYTISGHMAYHSAVIAKNYDVLLISDLPDDTVRSMGITPVHSWSEVVAIIKEKHTGFPGAYVMTSGGSTFPYY